MKYHGDADESATSRGPVMLVPEAQMLIAPTPSWNPATVERNAQLVEGSIYIVRSGDTLYGISNRTGAGADAIASANGLSAPFAASRSKAGIPAGLFHRVAQEKPASPSPALMA